MIDNTNNNENAAIELTKVPAKDLPVFQDFDEEQ